MSPSVIAVLAAQGIAVILAIVLVVQALRTHAGWVIFPLLLLGPFVCGLAQIRSPLAGLLALPGMIGTAVFALKHRQKAGILFLLYDACVGVSVALSFTSPPVIAFLGKYNPGFAAAIKTVNPGAYEEAQKLTPSGEKIPAPKPTPREVRDLAENEAPLPTPRVDPNPAARAAYAKHNKDLAALYAQLNAERGKLKPGASAALTAYNAKAAKYQQGITALADEKSKLDALDRAANLPADAAAALATMQSAVAANDYETFAATTKKALDEYRQTPSFPAIMQLARTTLSQVTADKVAAGVRDKAARTARGDFDKTKRQVQGIVNQTPAIVGQPPADAEVFHYAFHDGANPPDYKAENLLSTRELWKGQFVYMESAPGVFYHSADCEFNPQLKSFYLSRNVPKKRLTDAEYQELTRLFRLLGQQEKAAADAAPPAGLADHVAADLEMLKKQLDGYAMK